ncbi:MAG: gephyrin-like molybdotransferase Glp [Pseudomonadota bacterium]
MISVDEARARILKSLKSLPAEIVPIEQAWGRVLARPVFADRTHPQHDVSAMDGYAVRSEDVTDLPATLTVTQEIAAGGMPEKPLCEGEAARIFTGAPLPEGADTIVLQEDTKRLSTGKMQVLEMEAQRHVRARGLDFKRGALCVERGSALSSAHIGLMAAANVPSVYVHQRPVVAFLSTGSELVPHGTVPGPGQIVSSNGVMLSALAAAAGAIPLDLGAAPDDLDAIRAQAAGFERAHIAVTIGGASVGDHDLIQPALEPQGLEVDFWKVAMRPGNPLVYGAISQTPFLGLPGNPVSAFVCALLYLRPMIAKLSGQDVESDLKPDGERTLSDALPKNGPRMTFVRAATATDDARSVTPLNIQDSSVLSAVAMADCLIIRPPHAPAAEAGTCVSILSLKGA